MLLIAAIHLVWLLLVPVAAIIAIKSIRHGRPRWAVAAVAFAVLSLPAVLFCRQLWPLDYFWPGVESRTTTSAGGYTVSLVQKPGDDFYVTYFEITAPDGRVTRISNDTDDDKWWFPGTQQAGNVVHFTRGRTIDAAVRLDVSNLTLFGDYDGRWQLDQLDFSQEWTPER